MEFALPELASFPWLRLLLLLSCAPAPPSTIRNRHHGPSRPAPAFLLHLALQHLAFVLCHFHRTVDIDLSADA